MTLPAAPSGHTLPERRVDLDWLRIAAFSLLIFYHVGMFYVTWDFHVKSSRASEAIEPLMRLSNPWRLLLLFVISGVATRFMLDKMKPGSFLAARMARLLIPLVFGMLVIVPPQTWFEIVEKLGYSASIPDFYVKYVTMSGDWRPGGEYLITPTWNHLWFVAYLLVYTVLVVPLGPLLKRVPARLVAPLARGPAVVILPTLVLVILMVALRPLFGGTHALVDDWYLHSVYFSGFLFGYAVAKHERFFQSCEGMRWVTLGLAISAWVALEIFRATPIPAMSEPLRLLIGGALRDIQAWATIIAAFGFARRYLTNRDGPVRRYLTDAIFPFYIIHQTVIVIAGHHLDPLQLPVWIEAGLIIAITLASCWLGYEIVRRVPALRPLFGLKLEPKANPLQPVGAAG
jgi:surface polysaccharide O-acyltransferase-like enzyme/small basic protein